MRIHTIACVNIPSNFIEIPFKYGHGVQMYLAVTD